MDNQQKLERWARENFHLVMPNAIIPHHDGFIIFGRYLLQPQSDAWLVNKFTNDAMTFGSKRSAVSWCVADKFNRIALANRIKNIDNRIAQLGSDINVRDGLAVKTQNQKFRDIVAVKLANKRNKHRYLMAELQECINSAKYLQLRGFSNETARTGRSQ